MITFIYEHIAQALRKVFSKHDFKPWQRIKLIRKQRFLLCNFPYYISLWENREKEMLLDQPCSLLNFIWFIYRTVFVRSIVLQTSPTVRTIGVVRVPGTSKMERFAITVNGSILNVCRGLGYIFLDYSDQWYCTNSTRGHPDSTYAKFSEKLKFLTRS